MDNRKISKLVNQQLPEFIRTDHQKFVTFLEKYYEWLEVSGGITKEVDNLRLSIDIDTVPESYIDSLIDYMMPYFPHHFMADRRLFVKKIHEFYSRKGSEEALRFAFRAFYGEEIDVYFPKQAVLKVSDGKWINPLALRIDSSDPNILNIEKTLITGTNSKATALVEKVTRHIDRQLGVEYVEVYISNIERLFETGETITTVYKNSLGIDVPVTGRIVGALSEIKIDPLFRGSGYIGYDATTGYEGDPVTIVSGLNPTALVPVGAIATVGETTKGSVTDITVTNGGFGFRDLATFPGSSEIDFTGGFSGSTLAQISEAKASISLLDHATYRTINVASKTIESIYSSTISTIDPSSNTVIYNITPYQTLNVFPISFATMSGQGGGYKEKPTVDVHSYYNEALNESIIGTTSSPVLFSVVSGSSVLITGDATALLKTNYNLEKDSLLRISDISGKLNDLVKVVSATETTITIDIPYPVTATGLRVYKIFKNELKSLGSLGRISVITGGTGYAVGDKLVFSGGSGYGANGAVTSVHSGNTGIKTVDLVYHTSNAYVRGGEGYSPKSLPTITVTSAAGANAKLIVSEILGDGESFDLTTSRLGSISKLRISSYGYDYVTAPSISLRNMDVMLSNTTPDKVFSPGTKVYQGTSNTATSFFAYVDKYDATTGLLRLYNYSGTFNTLLKVESDDHIISGDVVSHVVYGDGKARATATFEHGLIRLTGIYINNDGHISSDRFIQDEKKYQNYSYLIDTSYSYSDYKKGFKEIFHPAGMKSLVGKVYAHPIPASISTNTNIELVKPLTFTFNVTTGSNTITSTNSSWVLSNTISVDDMIVINKLKKTITGLANVITSSNVVTGGGTNFINDIQNEDTLILHVTAGDDSVNTKIIVKSVESSNSLISTTNLPSSANNLYIKVEYNDLKKVNFVNANTIMVDTNFRSSATYATATHHKVI